MSFIKVGGPVYDPEQQMIQEPEQMILDQESELTYETQEKEPEVNIETPIGKFQFDSWFGLIAICVIIVVIGAVKKYLWTTNTN